MPLILNVERSNDLNNNVVYVNIKQKDKRL